MPSINFSKLLIEERRKLKEKKEQKDQRSLSSSSISGEQLLSSLAEARADEQMTDVDFFKEHFFTMKEIDFEKHRVCYRGQERKFIPGLFYVNDFISEEEERRIVRNIYITQTPSYSTTSSWVESGKRKILNIPNVDDDKNTPDFINALMKRLRETTAMAGDSVEANHVLINEYKDCKGIDPHFDGFVYNPYVCIVTTSGRALMDFWAKEECGSDTDLKKKKKKEDVIKENEDEEEKHDEEPVAQILLQPRSLLIYRDENNDQNGAYFLRHGIRHTETDDCSLAHAQSLEKVNKEEEDISNLPRSKLRHSIVFVRKIGERR